MKILKFLTASILFTSCGSNSTQNDEQGPVSSVPPPTRLNYTLLKVHPHDTTAYTQGLQYIDGFLYEGTGNPEKVPNKSKLRKVDYTTGKILKETFIPGPLFGEGITMLQNKIYQLTWTEKKGYIYQFPEFKLIREFSFDLAEGWGLTNNGKELIVSDGSSNIYFWNPETLKETKRISVQDNNGLRNNLNELEYINGAIYANVYLTDEILKIDPETGNVTGSLDFSDLRKNFPELNNPSCDYFNGIAWDSSGNRIFVTGKYWPKLFEIKLN
ncbi:MAG: glutaminyl-peptide cyclotransferase [Lacibacter sp.]